MFRITAMVVVLALLSCLPMTSVKADGRPVRDSAEEKRGRPELDFGFEAKVHFRDSDAFSHPLRVGPLDLGGRTELLDANLGVVDPGEHLEISTVTFTLDATWAEGIDGRIKVDFIDLYDRNPTSEDRQIDVDEAWIRFGHEMEPAELPEVPWGMYLKIGKMPKFERQDDRHLESYGLSATVFNRFEDLGVEFGASFGRHFYTKLTATQGNPLFMRDPNALAGDNGVPETFDPTREPRLGSGVVVPYDAEIEDLDSDGDLETGAALGLRFANASGDRAVDFMAFAYRRKLAETVALEGTLYGGDLDLLRGPLNQIPYALTDDDKSEFGANLWLYWSGFSLFGQWVEQDLAGLDRSAWEVELAWRWDLPPRWGVGGKQLFSYLQPAVRFSELDPQFGNPAGTPTPSFAWFWEKLDIGVRIGILGGIDLTLEYAANDFIVGGRTRSADELLGTLRWRLR